MNTQKRNYQKELDMIINGIIASGEVPVLTLHSCCAPCSSYPLEYLSEFFAINIVYYNPNISTREEYELRLSEQRRLVAEMELKNPISVYDGGYNPRDFYEVAEGLEKCPERGERCHRCYELRLRFAAEYARAHGDDYFATTLTLSPLKDCDAINSIGERLSREYGVRYLCTDFKKRNGYKRSIELSREHSLYRQNFCGCVYSRREE